MFFARLNWLDLTARRGLAKAYPSAQARRLLGTASLEDCRHGISTVIAAASRMTLGSKRRISGGSFLRSAPTVARGPRLQPITLRNILGHCRCVTESFAEMGACLSYADHRGFFALMICPGCSPQRVWWPLRAMGATTIVRLGPQRHAEGHTTPLGGCYHRPLAVSRVCLFHSRRSRRLSHSNRLRTAHAISNWRPAAASPHRRACRQP
jgi:hypothetical protein